MKNELYGAESRGDGAVPQPQHEDSPLGKIVKGHVLTVFPYAAQVALPGLADTGYLHISQIGLDYLPETADKYLSAGDPVDVKIIAFDERHSCWEVSKRAADIQRRWADSDLCKGKLQTGVVTRFTPFGATLSIEGEEIAHISRATSPHQGWWDVFEILQQCGQLSRKMECPVVFKCWDVHGRGMEVEPYVGHPEMIPVGSTHLATIIGARMNIIIRNGLHHRVFGRLETGELVYISATKYLHPERRFRLGDAVKVLIQKRGWLAPVLKAIPACDLDMGSKNPPAQGEILARVVTVEKFGAFCVIGDGQVGLLYHAHVIKDSDFDARRYLRLGDWVTVTVAEHTQANGKNRYSLRFVHLVESSFRSSITPRLTMIDLNARRRRGKSAGFIRDTDFRNMVLEAFQNRCCICGEQHVFGPAIAMEAAHIVPRGNRGADVLGNALCFCLLHHWAFDRGYIALDEDLCILVCDEVRALGVAAKMLSEHHGKVASLPPGQLPNPEALAWHRRNVFLG